MKTILIGAFRLLLVLATGALLSACGTSMPLSSKTKQLDLSEQSIGLLMLEQTREESRTMPWPRNLFVRNMATGKSQMVAVDTTFIDYGENGDHYVTPLRLALAPGKYRLDALHGTIQVFPLNGTFMVPLGLEFEVPAQSVFYMGRIHAHMRPRKGTEFRAGPPFPLIGQAALNIVTSTFDVQVRDAAATDLPIFREALPVLQAGEIGLHVLPAFDRSKFDALHAGVVDAKQGAAEAR
ncbi:hypothetical protein [Variovorax saccharolyticus]|uniref:hypothetical protein n=1 Tax=Variovorax saccharolyticus TaxID=3053516 RepID=UPI00257899E9|nr:hypothetical protein [Variovorax sp. J31P216]MDM0025092.1 hypothetical protein [Variovorax sp. J31P216]